MKFIKEILKKHADETIKVAPTLDCLDTILDNGLKELSLKLKDHSKEELLVLLAAMTMRSFALSLAYEVANMDETKIIDEFLEKSAGKIKRLNGDGRRKFN